MAYIPYIYIYVHIYIYVYIYSVYIWLYIGFFLYLCLCLVIICVIQMNIFYHVLLVPGTSSPFASGVNLRGWNHICLCVNMSVCVPVSLHKLINIFDECNAPKGIIMFANNSLLLTHARTNAHTHACTHSLRSSDCLMIQLAVSCRELEARWSDNW